MLKSNTKVAIFMEGFLLSDHAKMGIGVIRYLENPIIGVIDSENYGKNIKSLYNIKKDIPIYRDLDQVIEKGAEVLILGIAPSGGKIPEDWFHIIDKAIERGMSIINGLHDSLKERYSAYLNDKNSQWIWDVRKPKVSPSIASAKALELANKRLLMIGTDMACGKMTTALEVYKWAKSEGINSGFIATGQIGITLTGEGVPLDAIKVDNACGAIEQMVLNYKNKVLIIIEGQGSLLHPGSSATLPLMRGSCPTHMILCHRADKLNLRDPDFIKIPELKHFIQFNESVASCLGTYGFPKVIGIAINTSKLTNYETSEYIKKVEQETDLPVTDVIKFGVKKIVQGLM